MNINFLSKPIVLFLITSFSITSLQPAHRVKKVNEVTTWWNPYHEKDQEKIVEKGLIGIPALALYSGVHVVAWMIREALFKGLLVLSHGVGAGYYARYHINLSDIGNRTAMVNIGLNIIINALAAGITWKNYHRLDEFMQSYYNKLSARYPFFKTIKGKKTFEIIGNLVLYTLPLASAYAAYYGATGPTK